MVPVCIRCADAPLPCPMLYLHDAQALEEWHAAILSDAYKRGERALTLCCFPTLSSCALTEGCTAIAHAVRRFLAHHGDVEQLTLLCDGEESRAALSALLG